MATKHIVSRLFAIQHAGRHPVHTSTGSSASLELVARPKSHIQLSLSTAEQTAPAAQICAGIQSTEDCILVGWHNEEAEHSLQDWVWVHPQAHHHIYKEKTVLFCMDEQHLQVWYCELLGHLLFVLISCFSVQRMLGR